MSDKKHTGNWNDNYNAYFFFAFNQHDSGPLFHILEPINAENMKCGICKTNMGILYNDDKAEARWRELDNGIVARLCRKCMKNHANVTIEVNNA